MSDFLGPHGQATVILMKAHFDSELPKLKDLKKVLHIPDGRYYKSRGNFSNSIYRLTELLGIVSRIRKTGSNYKDHTSSDFLITVAEVHSNLFMALQYNAEVIQGFNLTDQNFEELAKLIDHFYTVHSMKRSVDDMVETLTSQTETAVEKGFTDTTILLPDIATFKNLLDGYGDAQQANAEQAIIDWYELNRWKVAASTKKASSSDEAEDEAETA